MPWVISCDVTGWRLAGISDAPKKESNREKSFFWVVREEGAWYSLEVSVDLCVLRAAWSCEPRAG